MQNAQKMYKKKVLNMYRDILRTTRKFKINPIASKIAFNAREMIEINKDFDDLEIIESLLEEGRNCHKLLLQMISLGEPMKQQIFDVRRWD